MICSLMFDKILQRIGVSKVTTLVLYSKLSQLWRLWSSRSRQLRLTCSPCCLRTPPPLHYRSNWVLPITNTMVLQPSLTSTRRSKRSFCLGSCLYAGGYPCLTYSSITLGLEKKMTVCFMEYNINKTKCQMPWKKEYFKNRKEIPFETHFYIDVQQILSSLSSSAT